MSSSNMGPPSGVPARTSSLAQWTAAHELAHQKSKDLKRKLSQMSFEKDPIAYTETRIEELDAETNIQRSERARFDFEDSSDLQLRNIKKARRVAQKRIDSLGDMRFKQFTKLQDLRNAGETLRKVSPDYKGLCGTVLRDLYRPEKSSRNKSLRHHVRQAYNSPAFANDSQRGWCPITRAHHIHSATVAHIVPLRLPKGFADYLFGPNSGSRIDSIDNCIPMVKSLEILFDRLAFVLLPVDVNETPLKRWRVQVTRSDRADDPVDLSRSLKDFDGTELEFQTDTRPAARFLYFHFIMSLLVAQDQQWLGYERNHELLSGHPFATWGRYLRKSVMLGMAMKVGDVSQDFSEALRKQDFGESDGESLNEDEELEVSRRTLDVVLGQVETAEEELEQE